MDATTLLGFLVPKTPIGLWFQEFVKAQRINVKSEMMSLKRHPS